MPRTARSTPVQLKNQGKTARHASKWQITNAISVSVLKCIAVGPGCAVQTGVAQRFDPDQKPSVLSVLSSYARLGLEQRARGKALIAQRDESIDVIGVDHLQRNVLAAQFLVRQAEVIESLLIRNNVAGVAIENKNVAGDRVDDRAKCIVGF